MPGEEGADCDGVMTVCIDGKNMVALDQETYSQLLSDLALVKVKLQRIYNVLLVSSSLSQTTTVHYLPTLRLAMCLMVMIENESTIPTGTVVDFQQGV